MFVSLCFEIFVFVGNEQVRCEIYCWLMPLPDINFVTEKFMLADVTLHRLIEYNR